MEPNTYEIQNKTFTLKDVTFAVDIDTIDLFHDLQKCHRKYSRESELILKQFDNEIKVIEEKIKEKDAIIKLEIESKPVVEGEEPEVYTPLRDDEIRDKAIKVLRKTNEQYNMYYEDYETDLSFATSSFLLKNDNMKILFKKCLSGDTHKIDYSKKNELIPVGSQVIVDFFNQKRTDG